MTDEQIAAIRAALDVREVLARKPKRRKAGA